jgi:RNA polymerase sigma-70 factor (ECF subfamily)
LNIESNAACGLPPKTGSTVIPEGDRAALEQLFASWMPRLSRAAMHILRNPEDSEDAMQDALLSAFQNLGQFEGRAKFTTWMYSILLNAVRAKLRKRKSHPETCSIDLESADDDLRPFAVAFIDTRPSPEQECAREEKGRIFAELFERLPAPYQTVIRLCDLEEMGQKEAAERLGLPLGTVKCQLHRARRLFSERARRARALSFRLDPHMPGTRARVRRASSPAAVP